jgi:ankyrin repeat protein
MGQLFDSGKPQFSAWIWIHGVDEGWRVRSIEDLDERPSEPEKTPLYYSAACGLRNLAEQLIAIHPNDVNPPDDHNWSPLRVAVFKEHLDVARLLLEHGADPNRVIGPWTLLHGASYSGETDVIELLLEHGADVDCISTDFDETPLHLASQNGHVKAMQQLLEYGADVNHRRRGGCTPLHRASCEGKPEAVRLLVRHGANINDKNNEGWTPLHGVAILSGDLETTQALLECGADVHATTDQFKTPFQLASREGHNDVAQLLLEYGAVAE